MRDWDRTDVEHLLMILEEKEALFGGYRFYKKNEKLCLLGIGGFSCVYEMVSTENEKKHYALKVIGLEKHTVSSAGFQKSIRLQRMLSGQTPHILRILDVLQLRLWFDENEQLIRVQESEEENWSGDGIPLQFILMEKQSEIFVKDRNKHPRLNRADLQTEEGVLQFAMQIGQAIQTAHQNQVLHRDIKLENIFWDEAEGIYKLGDFGIAKCLENGNAQTVVFSNGYGAPEIECRLRESYDVTADIYSFGISLYLLLNELKFPGSAGYYVNMVQYNPSFTFPAPKHSSEKLTRVIRKMCSYQKEERYQTMEAVLKDLKEIQKEHNRSDTGDTESEDKETETYREKTQTKNDTQEKSEKRKEPVQNTSSKRVEQAKQRRQMQDNQKYFNRIRGPFFFAFLILFFLFSKGMMTLEDVGESGINWLLPLVLLADAAFLYVKEFQILFGIVAFTCDLYAASSCDMQFMPILFLLCLITQAPEVIAAGALGTGAWMVLEYLGNLHALDWMKSYCIGWVFGMLLVLTIGKFLMIRVKTEQSDKKFL